MNDHPPPDQAALAALGVRIEAAHQQAHDHARSAVDHALECGQLLLEAKAALEHGQWLPWLSTHTTVGPRQAQRYMQLAEHRAALEGKYDAATHLTLTEALATLATPRPLPESEANVLPARRPVEFHPASAIIPPMTPAEYRRLVEDIRRHGVREPVLIHSGLLLDGRERWKACQELGIDCPFRVVTDADPVRVVYQENVLRQHYSEDQRAMMAARLANWGASPPSRDEREDRPWP
jgi:Protein of unknown function (DUF3102)/ParB/Sulfiredoxin domain